jgi:hypothetical protein
MPSRHFFQRYSGLPVSFLKRVVQESKILQVDLPGMRVQGAIISLDLGFKLLL